MLKEFLQDLEILPQKANKASVLYQQNQSFQKYDFIFILNCNACDTSFHLMDKIFSNLNFLNQRKYTLAFSSTVVPPNFIEADNSKLQLAYRAFHSAVTKSESPEILLETQKMELEAVTLPTDTIQDSTEQLRATYRVLPVVTLEATSPQKLIISEEKGQTSQVSSLPRPTPIKSKKNDEEDDLKRVSSFLADLLSAYKSDVISFDTMLNSVVQTTVIIDEKLKITKGDANGSKFEKNPRNKSSISITISVEKFSCS